jgi:hypothetical protein
MKRATQDSIIATIHVLWERGWEVTIEAVREFLRVGDTDCPDATIEAAIAHIAAPGEKERWLSYFNQHSEWARQRPRPWPIDKRMWKHQQQENEA